LSARTLRWTLLAATAVLLAVTFFVSQVREMRRALAGPAVSSIPPALGRVPDFTLTDRDGSTVDLDELAGEPWVADFIFTRCALSCPRLTSVMRRLGADAPGVARVSITVDPEHDTPQVLGRYAESWAVDDPSWRFLSGSTEAVEALVVGGFKLPVIDAPPPELATAEEPILHSDRFVLVDASGVIRGYYEAVDETEYGKLLRDLRHLVSAPRSIPPSAQGGAGKG
jgi:protein SCO1/2